MIDYFLVVVSLVVELALSANEHVSCVSSISNLLGRNICSLRLVLYYSTELEV